MAINYQVVLWDSAGKPYWSDPATGQKSYVPPTTAAQSDDPQLQAWAVKMGATPTSSGAPGGGLVHGRGQWNDQTGEWDQHLAGGNLLSLGIGGLIAAPFVAGALGGGAGAGAAGSGAAAPATAGTLGSTTIGTGAATLPAVSASGAVPAAYGGAATAGGIGGGVAATGSSSAATGSSGAATGAGTGGSTATSGIVSTTPTGSIWSRLAGPIIGTGADLVKGYLGSKASKDAAATQAAAGAKSLALQKQIYDQGQANLSPYMSAGAGAITNLRGLTGQSLTPAPASPMTAPGQFPGGHPGLFPGSTEYAQGEGPANLGMPLAAGPPAAISAPSLNSLASQQTSSGYVTMRSPDGKSTKAVPPDQVAHYQQQGAQVVS